MINIEKDLKVGRESIAKYGEYRCVEAFLRYQYGDLDATVSDEMRIQPEDVTRVRQTGAILRAWETVTEREVINAGLIALTELRDDGVCEGGSDWLEDVKGGGGESLIAIKNEFWTIPGMCPKDHSWFTEWFIERALKYRLVERRTIGGISMIRLLSSFIDDTRVEELKLRENPLGAWKTRVFTYYMGEVKARFSGTPHGFGVHCILNEFSIGDIIWWSA